LMVKVYGAWRHFQQYFSYIMAVSFIGRENHLLVEKTRGPGENHWPAASHWQIYHIMLYTSPWEGVEPTTSVVIPW
jgi:hypothetical protein